MNFSKCMIVDREEHSARAPFIFASNFCNGHSISAELMYDDQPRVWFVLFWSWSTRTNTSQGSCMGTSCEWPSATGAAPVTINWLRYHVWRTSLLSTSISKDGGFHYYLEIQFVPVRQRQSTGISHCQHFRIVARDRRKFKVGLYCKGHLSPSDRLISRSSRDNNWNISKWTRHSVKRNLMSQRKLNSFTPHLFNASTKINQRGMSEKRCEECFVIRSSNVFSPNYPMQWSMLWPTNFTLWM